MSQKFTRRKMIKAGLITGGSAWLLPGLAENIDHPIVRLAREEANKGKFRIMVSSPKQEAGHKMIMDAFHQRFQLKTDWEWLPLTSPVSGPRIAELAKTGGELPSAIGGYGYNTYEPFIGRNKLAMEIDWLNEFGELLPDIAVALSDIPASFQSVLLRQWDVIYTWAFNTNNITAEQLPSSLEEVADKKWAGNFIMSNVNSSPLEIWGILNEDEEYTLSLVDKLLKNKPRFKAGPPAAVGAVAAGEVPLAICGYTALAQALKKKGAPIDWAPVGNQVFVQPLFVFMLKDAPLPNLGKLFLAWLCSEGRSLQEEAEELSMWGDESSATMIRLRELSDHLEPVMVTSDNELERMFDLDKKIMDRVAGVTGKAHS